MPEKHEFLPMSLVTFSRARREEIYLLYSQGFEEGPGIHRDGQGSPWMIDAALHARKVTDPHEQRKDTWLVNDDARDLVRQSVDRWIQDVRSERDAGLMDAKDAEHRLAYYRTFVESLDELPDYQSRFRDAFPEREIVGMQGCGNLSMNEWYVAYVRSPFTHDEPRLIALPEDRINRVPPRHYTCLVKYHSGEVRIEPLFFNLLRHSIFSNTES